MPRSSLSYTDRRRARLALKFDRIESMESRSLITDPINLFALSMGLPTAANLLAGTPAFGEGTAGQAAVRHGAATRDAVTALTSDTSGWQ